MEKRGLHNQGGERPAHRVYATVAELQAKGVTFTRPITDAGWGLLTALELPDGRELALYEPRHPRPLGPSD